MSKFIRDKLIDGDEKFMLLWTQYEDGSSNLSPLTEYLKINDLMQYFSIIPFGFGDIRGYRCSWEIIDKKLYLVSFKSTAQRLYKTAQLFGEMPIEPYTGKMQISVEMKSAVELMDLETRRKILLKNSERKQIVELLNKLYYIAMQKTPLPKDDERDNCNFSEDTTHVFAKWFSGNLVAYNRFPDNDEDLNGCSYRIEQGILSEKIPQHIKRSNI
ncbi:MAG: hypothetical protein A3E21_00525 [Sulfurimonas sp. RIFCSPHIGHO2_12_FULL_36_9]|uniref:hypothetical protein n=1 Tax=Sulfurimonas sp. RIFCSPLOWO2_12_36_12 TaxID=1802253 RepID=UPI0008CDBE38|nr:hypothetical protein [Sulfurimonas sp. RIFCSPLOWO2_12_36_12]OHD96232.1 MAG: hypothetical protein A3E21_00525 [Sulfurimonas sp. RIFCSPHIGHO2_12_FULL_36_9]OHE00709.1 MAG: hypothetical protein A3J26_05445 [Sulfurimonas sp. RIFCSPLOWO2_02_FULL_36_28]OHE02038.1 MAG: hypothetical protein A2W82_04940 [Sulfurimonas sp. RIFCSPLOWO2_12_36_12]